MKRNAVLLINPYYRNVSPHTHFGKILRNYPPLALLAIGTYLKKHGHEVFIIDAQTEPDYQQKLDEFFRNYNVLVVGISVYVGQFIASAKYISSYLKSRFNVPIVWGGPLPSSLPESCLNEECCDYVITTAGEEPLRLLVESLSGHMNISDVPNLGWKANGEIHMNAPMTTTIVHNDVYDWSMVGDKINFRQYPYVVTLFTTRGCPYKCTFCFKEISGYYSRDVDNVLKEMDMLYNEYDVNVFTIYDDNFFYDKKRAIEILTFVRDRGYYIEYVAGSYADLIDRDVLNIMKDTCNTAYYAIESASPRLIRQIKKPVVLKNVIELDRIFNEFQMTVRHNFIFGFPSETDEDRKMAVDLMIQDKFANPNVYARCFFCTPYPMTTLFHESEQQYGAFPRSLDFWEKSDGVGCTPGLHNKDFRPWLSDEDSFFVPEFISLFNDTFLVINKDLSPIKKRIARSQYSARLMQVFKELDCITSFPPNPRPHYLLDEIIEKRWKEQNGNANT